MIEDPSIFLSKGLDIPNGYKLKFITTNEELIFNIQKTTDLNYLDYDENIFDNNKYKLLLDIKNTYPKYNGSEILRKLNPYANLDKDSIFIDRAAIKLANIDAVFNITYSDNETKPLLFYDLAGGPGAFTEYIFYRKPEARGLGMSLLLNDNRDWNPILQESENFTIDYGLTLDGDLFKNYRYIINGSNSELRESKSKGKGFRDKLDLAVADGALSSEGKEMYQEHDTARLVLTELYIATMCITNEGYCVCKIFDSITKLTRDIIVLMSRCFEEVYIFKPISSRAGNSERYIICHKKKENINKYLKIIPEIIELFNTGIYVSSFLEYPNGLYENIKEYLYETNMENINRQLYYGKLYLQYLKTSILSTVNLNLFNVFLGWNIVQKGLYIKKRKIIINQLKLEHHEIKKEVDKYIASAPF